MYTLRRRNARTYFVSLPTNPLRACASFSFSERERESTMNTLYIQVCIRGYIQREGKRARRYTQVCNRRRSLGKHISRAKRRENEIIWYIRARRRSIPINHSPLYSRLSLPPVISLSREFIFLHLFLLKLPPYMSSRSRIRSSSP